MAKTTTIKGAEFALSLSPLSKRIFAGKVKIMSNGDKHWAQSVGAKHDVTHDFYYILLALAEMVDNLNTQGSFIFDEIGDTPYKVTIEAVK